MNTFGTGLIAFFVFLGAQSIVGPAAAGPIGAVALFVILMNIGE